MALCSFFHQSPSWTQTSSLVIVIAYLLSFPLRAEADDETLPASMRFPSLHLTYPIHCNDSTQPDGKARAPPGPYGESWILHNDAKWSDKNFKTLEELCSGYSMQESNFGGTCVTAFDQSFRLILKTSFHPNQNMLKNGLFSPNLLNYCAEHCNCTSLEQVLQANADGNGNGKTRLQHLPAAIEPLPAYELASSSDDASTTYDNMRFGGAASSSQRSPRVNGWGRFYASANGVDRGVCRSEGRCDRNRCQGNVLPGSLSGGRQGKCACLARPAKAKGRWSLMGCGVQASMAWKGGMGGRRVKRDDMNGVSCACNGTYVSHGCCGADDGLVWEAPEMMLGIVDEADEE